MCDFKPDWVSPPGDTIKELMMIRLAASLYLSQDNTLKLLQGDYPLTDNIINSLDGVFGDLLPINKERSQSDRVGTTSYWQKREARYREEVERIYNIDVGEIEAIIKGKVNQTYYSNARDVSPNGKVITANNKYYLVQNQLYDGKLIKLIRHLTHDDLATYGFYWHAAQNFKDLFTSKPSFEVTLKPRSIKKYVPSESLIKLSDATYKVCSTPTKFN